MYITHAENELHTRNSLESVFCLHPLWAKFARVAIICIPSSHLALFDCLHCLMQQTLMTSILQVTTSSARLVSCETRELVGWVSRACTTHREILIWHYGILGSSSKPSCMKETCFVNLLKMSPCSLSALV